MSAVRRVWQKFARICKKAKKEVLASAPYVSDQALLANAGEVRGVQIRGYFAV